MVKSRRYLTTGHVAKACGVSMVTVKKWIRQGKLKAFRTPGHHFRVIPEDLRRFQREYGFLEEAPSPPRVLLVDDDAELVALLLEGLGASRPALKVEAAYDGYEGILKVGTFRPHVLLWNPRMPGMDGFRACRRIKENPSTQATKILAITAYPEDAGPNGSLAIGADAFLTKPFTISRLKAEVRRLLKSAAAPLKMVSEEADPQLAVPSA